MAHVITPDLARAEIARRAYNKTRGDAPKLAGISPALTNLSGAELQTLAGLAPTGTAASTPRADAPKRTKAPKAPKAAKTDKPGISPELRELQVAANAAFTAAKNTHGLKAGFQARREYLAGIKALAA